MTESETQTERHEPIEYVVGLLLGMVVGLTSLAGGVLLSVGPDPVLSPGLGAAWAWAIGAGTGLYVVPWVKQAVRPVEGGADA